MTFSKWLNCSSDFSAFDTGNAWFCSMDGRVLSCADFVMIEEDDAISKIKVYPNPVNDLLNIELNRQGYSDINLAIFSIDGKNLLSKSFTGLHEDKIRLDISFLTTGIYFLNVNSSGIYSIHKIIKL